MTFALLYVLFVMLHSISIFLLLYFYFDSTLEKIVKIFLSYSSGNFIILRS